MPRKGYATITVKAEVKEKLEEYARAKGFGSLGDAVAHLLDLAQQSDKGGCDNETMRKTYLAVLRIIEELKKLTKD